MCNIVLLIRKGIRWYTNYKCTSFLALNIFKGMILKKNDYNCIGIPCYVAYFSGFIEIIC